MSEVTVIKEMLGKVYTSVKNNGNDELVFDGENNVKFYHEQDCCEDVSIESIVGDLKDLENTPILQAEYVTECKELDEYESQTWTFYKYATIKGSVTVRWLGESNGYYSELVDVSIDGNRPWYNDY